MLSIAVIHHIATTERRVRALRELARVSLDDGDCDDVNIDALAVVTVYEVSNGYYLSIYTLHSTPVFCSDPP